MIEYVFEVLTEHVSFVEFIWFLIMLFGFIRYGLNRYVHTFYVRSNYKREDETHCDDSVKLQLDARAFRYLTIAVIFWLWLLLGLRAMLVPNPPSVNSDIEQIVLLAVLVTGAALLFLKGEYYDVLEGKSYRKYREEITEKINDDVHGMMMKGI